MTEYIPPPPPSAAPTPAPPAAPTPAKKEGLPPLAWVGIGCGALLLIALIVFAAGTWFVAEKARDFAASVEENPMAAVEMAIRLNPDLEVVESDEAKGTITVRNKETGEEITVNLDEFKEGRLSVLTGEGEESSIQVGQREGGIEITSEKDGQTSRLRIGAGSEDVPDWVPKYPGSQPTGTYIATTAEGTSGTFGLTTSDAPEEVIEWYADELEDLGLTVERSTFATPVSRGG